MRVSLAEEEEGGGGGGPAGSLVTSSSSGGALMMMYESWQEAPLRPKQQQANSSIEGWGVGGVADKCDQDDPNTGGLNWLFYW